MASIAPSERFRRELDDVIGGTTSTPSAGSSSGRSSLNSSSSACCSGRDLAARGMRPPVLVVADGAPGLWKAARELWPQALEQPCTVHYPDLRVMPTWDRQGFPGAVSAAVGSA